jgi:hypothetical protein
MVRQNGFQCFLASLLTKNADYLQLDGMMACKVASSNIICSGILYPFIIKLNIAHSVILLHLQWCIELSASSLLCV